MHTTGLILTWVIALMLALRLALGIKIDGGPTIAFGALASRIATWLLPRLASCPSTQYPWSSCSMDFLLFWRNVYASLYLGKYG